MLPQVKHYFPRLSNLSTCLMIQIMSATLHSVRWSVPFFSVDLCLVWNGDHDPALIKFSFPFEFFSLKINIFPKFLQHATCLIGMPLYYTQSPTSILIELKQQITFLADKWIAEKIFRQTAIE